MKAVWKFEFSVDDYIDLSLPKNAQPLSVQTQNGTVCLWCLVNPDEMIYEQRRFRLTGTGHPIEEKKLEFIGTFQLYNGSFVGHLFEIK